LIVAFCARNESAGRIGDSARRGDAGDIRLSEAGGDDVQKQRRHGEQTNGTWRCMPLEIATNSGGEITSEIQVAMDTNLYAMSLFGKNLIYNGYVIFGVGV
jgi:hypothetical protein